MRKISAWVLSMGLVVGLVVGLVAGCGGSNNNIKSTLETQAGKLEATNYHSQATMTVQMENGSQTYFIQTDYDSPDKYKISLGDANKNINQIIVKNESGMFVVSPTLQKVFRFNGNWAQNQGHIYLYDQILQQLANSKDLSTKRSGGQYTFDMPITSDNDVVTKQRVELDTDLKPKKVILFDSKGKEIVIINFTEFSTGNKFQNTDFDPNKIAAAPNATKPTMATTGDFGLIEPNDNLGSTLANEQSLPNGDALLRYTGDHGFTLEEYRPTPGVAGLPTAALVDLYGVPALFSGSDNAHRLVWTNNGVQFALTSGTLTLDEMKSVAISTLGQVGK